MVDSTGGRHGGSELGDGSCNEPVEEGDDEEFIEHAGWSTVVDCDRHTSAKGHPDIAACDGESADSEEAEVAVEFLLVAGCVDGELSEGVGNGFRVLFQRCLIIQGVGHLDSNPLWKGFKKLRENDDND